MKISINHKVMLNFRKIWSVIVCRIPLLLAAGTYIFLYISLQCKLCSEPEFIKTLAETRVDIITVSGILSGIIMAYLTSKVLQIRNERIAKMPELHALTQKLHRFRAIVNKLINSNLWVNGLRTFVNNNKGLSYFDVQSNTPSAKAKMFINENKFGDTKYLYLELKSFINDNAPFDNTLHPEFDVPVLYNSKILEKWMDYDCGNGLWRYFDHKYAVYRSSLNLNNVYPIYQEEIKKLAIQIDKNRYEKIDFGHELLAELGTQVHSEIIPKLYRLQLDYEGKLPSFISYLFVVFVLLVAFGVLFPLLTKIFSLCLIFDILSISVIVSVCVYIVASFYRFLKSEILIGK